VTVLSDNGHLLGEHGTTGKSHWWDAATRVPLLLRCPGVEGNADGRLAATIDIAPTLLRAAGAGISTPLDGRALQEEWDRHAVLVESWDKDSDGNKRRPFTALKGRDWIYVEPQGKPPGYYTLPGEKTDHYRDLGAAESDRLAAWLAALRACKGEACHRL
jgi:arylsulfatase A-like enzyme